MQLEASRILRDYPFYLLFSHCKTERPEMHIISLLKLLLSILRKAQNFSTPVALRLITAIRRHRHVLSFIRSGAAKSLVRFWLWIVSGDSKSNLQGLSTGVAETENVIEAVAERNDISINANSSEISARWTFELCSPSCRNRYDRHVSMYVMSVAMFVCEPARSLL